jgi:hypothetical protein
MREPKKKAFDNCRAHFDKCTVLLRLTDTDLDPDAMTKRLGVAPTSTFRKGDARGAGKVAEWGSWICEIEGVPPKLPTELALELLAPFPTEPELWQALRGDCFVELVFSFERSTWSGCFTLSPELVALAAKLGAGLEVHIYAS